jgi:hypothetical protein
MAYQQRQTQPLASAIMGWANNGENRQCDEQQIQLSAQAPFPDALKEVDNHSIQKDNVRFLIHSNELILYG